MTAIDPRQQTKAAILRMSSVVEGAPQVLSSGSADVLLLAASCIPDNPMGKQTLCPRKDED